jgi:hypothetical protein
MRVSGPNLSTGFYASAVDVGRLQAALEHGLARFDETQLERRWDEILGWMRRVTRTWVQRCKRMRIECRQTGIRIELETQDDFGYYEYGFDVIPSRLRARLSYGGWPGRLLRLVPAEAHDHDRRPASRGLAVMPAACTRSTWPVSIRKRERLCSEP